MKDFYVNRYTVCWQDTFCCWEWKHKVFSNKKEAKQFAKRLKWGKPYPYIMRDIVSRSFFKQDCEVERADVSLTCSYTMRDYKYIKY